MDRDTKEQNLKRLYLCVAAALAAAVLGGSAQAASPTACTLVSKAEYQRILHKPVKITSGEGTTSCNVTDGRQPMLSKFWVIPNLAKFTPRYRTYVKGLYARGAKVGLKKLPALGPMGASLASGPGVAIYFQKGDWFVALQGEKGVTRTQMLALASLAYHRL